MFLLHLFGFVAVTLCILAFVSAHGEENREDAEEKVKEAKKLTDEVFQTIQRKCQSAEEIKEKVESRKAKTESAANDAQKSAGKDNEEAAIFAEKAKKELTDYLTLYEDAKQKAQEAVDQTSALLAQARDLVKKARIQISPASNSQTDYTQVSENAAEVKNDTEKLKNEITAAERLISVANSKLWPLETHAKDAQVAKYQVDAIVKVAEIKSMLTKADADIKVIEQKQNEVNATVEAIKNSLKIFQIRYFKALTGFLITLRVISTALEKALRE